MGEGAPHTGRVARRRRKGERMARAYNRGEGPAPAEDGSDCDCGLAEAIDALDAFPAG